MVIELKASPWGADPRGFFEDARGTKCSVTANERRGRLYLTCPAYAMSLNPAGVRALLPHLKRFAETGRLGP